MKKICPKSKHCGVLTKCPEQDTPMEDRSCMQEPEPTFTINEIKEYLEGCRFEEKPEWNHALNDAIIELEDKEDGITATTERNKGEVKQ